MRQTYRKLTKTMREDLENHLRFNQDQVDLLVRVEMMLFGLMHFSSIIPATEVWAIIPGYNSPILPQNADVTIINRLRILFIFYRKESIWQQDLSQYKEFSSDKRLFAIDEFEQFIVNKDLKLGLGRKENYRKLLSSPIERWRHQLSIASIGQYEYTRLKDHEKFKGQVVFSKLTDPIPKFSDYREKKCAFFTGTHSWASIAASMDDVRSLNKWRNACAETIIRPIEKQKILEYKGIQHIVGGLGTGKSNFITLETVRLVKQEQMRIGIVVEKVSQVLEKVEELTAYGIRAAPVIGRQRQKYLKEYLETRRREGKCLDDWDALEQTAMAYLSGKCFLRAEANDHDAVEHYPCERLIEEKGKKPHLCPYGDSCGFYANIRDMINADVWVTTGAAVLKSRLPKHFDSLERPIYEAIYDLLDVIFVDEADQVQRQFDNAFFDEYELLGTPEGLVEKLYSQVMEQTSTRYDKFAGGVVADFRNATSAAMQVVWNLYGLLQRSPQLRRHLGSRKVFYIYHIVDDLVYTIGGDDELLKSKVRKDLKEYISNPLSSAISIWGRQLHNDNLSPKDRRNSMINCLEQWGRINLSGNGMDRLLEKLEFIFYLGMFENYWRYINQMLVHVQQYVDLKMDQNSFFRLRREYLPFLKDGMTGMLLGYRYLIENNDSGLGKFKFFEYSGVGRRLLTEWSDLYMAADGKIGPAIVLLSGTSYAPGSAHYHLDPPVGWLIEANRKQPQLSQHVIAFDDGKGLVAISGTSDKEERARKLSELTSRMKPLIKKELSHHAKQGSHRKVILIVNSYEDVITVKHIFAASPEWKGRVLALRNDSGEADGWFSRNFLEKFRHEKADVLIAPLLAISRGYNILDDEGGALFGSVFFLIRPYPTPDDFGYVIETLHAYLPRILKQLADEGKTWSEGIKGLRKYSIAMMEKMVQKPSFWATLEDDERLAMSWYIFVPLWQVIGRLIRGGRDARVFYLDAKFSQKSKNTPSLLDCWKKIFADNHDEIINALYDPFIKSLPNLVEEGE